MSKGVPVERIRAAHAAGIAAFGENRVQEAETKVSVLPPVIAWHLVGRLQANKVARAASVFGVIHSVDSLELARRLHRAAPPDGMPVYIQVNVDADPAKTGFTPDGLADSLPEIAALGSLELRGLMTIGRLVEDARDERGRRTFAALRELSEKLRTSHTKLGPGLSMGMSADFEVAVEEGATAIRVGTAIFGTRALG